MRGTGLVVFHEHKRMATPKPGTIALLLCNLPLFNVDPFSAGLRFTKGSAALVYVRNAPFSMKLFGREIPFLVESDSGPSARNIHRTWDGAHVTWECLEDREEHDRRVLDCPATFPKQPDYAGPEHLVAEPRVKPFQLQHSCQYLVRSDLMLALPRRPANKPLMYIVGTILRRVLAVKAPLLPPQIPNERPKKHQCLPVAMQPCLPF